MLKVSFASLLGVNRRTLSYILATKGIALKNRTIWIFEYFNQPVTFVLHIRDNFLSNTRDGPETIIDSVYNFVDIFLYLA